VIYIFEAFNAGFIPSVKRKFLNVIISSNVLISRNFILVAATSRCGQGGSTIKAFLNSFRIFYPVFIGWTLLLTPLQVGAEGLDFIINDSNGNPRPVHYPQQWETIDEGIGYKKVVVGSGDPFFQTILKFVKIDPGLFRVKILTSDQFDLNEGFYARTIAEKTNAALVINGSYFDENRKPLGFLVSDGKALNTRVATNWIYSGLFYIMNDKPFLVNRENFPQGQAVEQAIQAGPYLMDNGAPYKKIKNLHASHFRSGIGITHNNEIFVFVTDTKYGGISWHELLQILSLPDLQCAQAMNLDGGGSTQMALSTKAKREYIDGTSKIPVAIGFFKK
jgi:exopolysaccharide biosynthesis protein